MSAAGDRVREALEAALTPPLPGFVTRVEIRTSHEAALARLEAVVEAARRVYEGWLAGEFDWDELQAALRALDEEPA